MIIRIFTYLIFSLTSLFVKGQVEFFINDEPEFNNIFSGTESRMLDTASIRFNKGKESVLEYCSENLNFNIDSTATLYSCREYFKPNPNNTKKERKIIDRKCLKYKFFINFKVNEKTTYYTSFYLDTMMHVHYSSMWLFNECADKVWDIKPWQSIYKDLAPDHGEYILPIESVDIEYSEKYDEYIYVIVQQRTEETQVEKSSEFSETWSVNKLIISAKDSKMLEKTQESYRSMWMPSW